MNGVGAPVGEFGDGVAEFVDGVDIITLGTGTVDVLEDGA